jgi:Ras homolog gene family, member A
LWDTAGLEDYDRLRPLSYPDAHVVLFCFAIDSPDSLDNIWEKVFEYLNPYFNLFGFQIDAKQWRPEVNHFLPGVPKLLIGCKKELRDDPKTIEELKRTEQTPVTREQARKPF